MACWISTGNKRIRSAVSFGKESVIISYQFLDAILTCWFLESF